ncbi:MAG: DNA-binding protein [Gammaproteobacteria bacterium]|nr:MAG: DNA-binding protein [Gammaproteobacteria bacterium]
MCQIYSSTPLDLYRRERRSVRMHGHVTSIKLEALYWQILDRIAEAQGYSTPRFITELYDEILEEGREPDNFASLLRVICTRWAGSQLPETLSFTPEPTAEP